MNPAILILIFSAILAWDSRECPRHQLKSGLHQTRRTANPATRNNAILQKRKVIHHINHRIKEVCRVSRERIDQSSFHVTMHRNQSKGP